MNFRPGIVVAMLWAAALPGLRADSPPFSAERLSFSLGVRGEVSPYSVLAVSVTPGELLGFKVAGPDRGRRFTVESSEGEVRRLHRRSWEWRAPAAKGLYRLAISEVESRETARLNVFVVVPMSEIRAGMLNGYRIGEYPTIPLKGLEIYKPPRGFIEVTEDNVDTPVSPHFTLGQFLCKQDGGFPKYVVLRERLLLKLEHLLEVVNAAGIRADTFHVMSGYRTPFYNRAIDNVKYSRHVYGGAADIFIDENPRDGDMDDLNGDGTIDVHDAGVLYDLIDRQYGKPAYDPLQGGLGRYRRTTAHGPFVHVDVRGFRARWGT